MSTSLHKNLGYAETHVAHSLEFADATARNAFSATASDVGRIAKQTDTQAFYILQDDSPLTWVELGAGTVPDASESTKGKAELATQAETNAGTDDTRIVTPLKLANYSGLGGGTAVDDENMIVAGEVFR